MKCKSEKAMAPHMDMAAVHGVTRSRTRLSDFTFTFHFHALEKEMATHSSTLPGESLGQRSLVGYSPWGRTELTGLMRLSSSSSSSSGKESACNAGDQNQSPSWEDPWRREWQRTPIVLPGKFHGQRSLAGYSPWGH